MWQRLILHVSTASQQHADQIILHHRRHGYRRGRGKGRSPDGKAESWWLRNGIGNVVESTVATSRISGCSPRCNGSPVCQPSQRWSPLPNRRPPRLSRQSASGQTEPSDAVIASDRKSAHCGLSPTAAPKHEPPLNRLSRRRELVRTHLGSPSPRPPSCGARSGDRGDNREPRRGDPAAIGSMEELTRAARLDNSSYTTRRTRPAILLS